MKASLLDRVSKSPVQKRIRRAMNHHLRFAVVLAGRLTGRGTMHQPESAADRATLMRGLTLILPGIEATGPCAEEMHAGLRDGHVPGAIELFYWGIPFPEGYLRNLIDRRRNQQQAVLLAERIRMHQDQFPHSPIHLVANSGGVGPALTAIKMLAPDRPIAGLVILAGAASYNYDLFPVLARCDKGVLSTYSCRDSFTLNLGTRIFGTADRIFAPSCGYQGFSFRHDKLRQIEWAPHYGRQCGWWGTHGTSTSREFIGRHIAPWITAPCR